MEKQYTTRTRDGFTLVEIIISVSIILLFMGLARVKDGSEIFMLENTANEMVSALRLTKQISESGDQSAYFSIRKDKDGFYFTITERINNISKETERKRVHRNIQIMLNDSEPENYEPTKSEIPLEVLKVTFSETTGTGATIFLRSKNTKKLFRITIVPTSGRVHLYKFRSQG